MIYNMQGYESIHIQNSMGILYGLRDQEKPLFRSNISPKRNRIGAFLINILQMFTSEATKKA